MNASKHKTAATVVGVIITVVLFMGMLAFMMGSLPV